MTVCFKHTDFANLPFGLCAVTSLGSYDATKGGHLVLWEYRLVIEFHRVSAGLHHLACIWSDCSNVPVQLDESQYSVVQYSAGALFRWVENGFQRSHDYLQSLSEAKVSEVRKNDTNRWALGRSLLPVVRG